MLKVIAFAVVSIGLAMTSLAFARPSGPCLVPTPDLSVVPRCLAISPDGSLVYRVTIIGCGGPIIGSNVEVRFNTVGDTLVCWCNTVPGPRPRSFFATTNSQGVAQFNIAAGGCIQYALAAIPGPLDFAAEVFADNSKMEECGTVSPDAVDAAGRLPTSTPVWNPAGNCRTGLSDAVQHTLPLSTNTYDWCSDVNCDNVVGLADASILTPYLANAATCSGDQGP